MGSISFRASLQIAALLTLVSTLAASAPQSGDDKGVRSSARGRCLDASGQPWANARVTLAARSIAREMRSSIDVVKVQCDARGRFTARLLPGRSYDGWAVSAPDGASQRISALVSSIIPGRTITLREERAHTSRRIRITRRDAWEDREPLSFRLVLDAPSVYSEPFEVDEKGEAVLPSMPGLRSQVFVEDRFLTPVCIAQVEQAVGTAADVAAAAVALPERFPFLVRVKKNPPGGQLDAIPIYQRIARFQDRDVWSQVGETDVGGWAKLSVVPYQLAPAAPRQYVFLRAWGKGVPMTQGGKSVTLVAGRDLDKMRASNVADVLLTVQMPSRSIKGRVSLSEGVPFARRRLLLYSSIGNARSQNFNLAFNPLVLTTDESGGFEATELGVRAGFRLVAELEETDLAKLAGDDERTLAPFAILDVGVLEADLDLGELRLDRLARFDVDVVKPDRFPAPGAEFILGEYGRRARVRSGLPAPAKAQTAMLSTQLPLRASVDRRGRIRVLLPPQDLLTCAVFFDGSFATAQVDLAKAATEQVAPTELRLQSTIPFVGRVVNGDGKPVPGALLTASPMRWPAGFNTRLSSLIVQGVNKTDAKGRFRIGLPFSDTVYYLYARYPVGKRWFTSQGRILIETTEDGVEPQELDVEIPVPSVDLPGGARRAATKGTGK